MNQINGMYFGGVDCSAAEKYARLDAVADIEQWSKGSGSDKVLHEALNAIEDMVPGTKTIQLTDAIRQAVFYEDEERREIVSRALPALKRHAAFNGGIKERY